MTHHPFINALRPLLEAVRTDATATKAPDKDTGEIVVQWRREPLTTANLIEHFDGTSPRGVCPIKAGEDTTRVGLLDFDSHKGASTWEEMTAAGMRVIDAAIARGLRPHAWRSSGGNGFHVCFLWAAPQDARSVRVLLCDVLADAGLKNGTKGVAAGVVEVFPKQDRVPLDGFGNQFFLPGHNKSVPLSIPFELALEPREAFATFRWEFSPPVPVVEKSTALVVQNSRPPQASIAEIRDHLFSIDNSFDPPDYEEWRDITFAVHHGTGGSDEGLRLMTEWSKQNVPAWERDPTHLERRVWPYIDSEREGGITIGSLFAKARAAGYLPAVTADGFTFKQPPVPAPYDPQAGAQAPDGEDDPDELPPFGRDKNGRIEMTIGNALLAIRRADLIGARVAYDSFKDEILLAPPGTEQWRPFTDNDYVYVRQQMENIGFAASPGREMTRDVVAAVAGENKFDSAEQWLDSLTRDSVDRCEMFLHRYLGCEDTPYTRAVSLYMWTALAGRVKEPGVKADMVPILIGSQGAGKSTAVGALVPSVDFFCEVSFTEKDDDLSRKMRGKLVAEIGELRGLHTRELEAIKAFVTRTHESWVPKFKEFTTNFPRRLLFIGTTNQEQFLADETGHRRWLPVRAGVHGPMDVEGLRRDSPLLWAEGRELFAAGGVQWQEAERLARGVHAEHELSDAWEPVVAKWLDTPDFANGVTPRAEGPLTAIRVLCGALGFDAKSVKRAEEMRIGAVLRALGYSRRRVAVDGAQKWRYLPTLPTSCLPDLL